MERESFCDQQVADLLNASFIPIKLDRESRPDLDEIYMSFVTATTGSGGWPLNVFLTPDLKPVFGGTYWPGSSTAANLHQSSGVPDEAPTTFLEVLNKMQEVWTTQQERCVQSASDITKQLQEFAAEGIHSHSDVQTRGESTDEPEPLDLDLLDDALSHFVSRYDAVNGGFSPSANAPKFPTPVILTFLLRIGASATYPSTHTRFGFPTPIPGILGKESCVQAASMALHTLFAMSRSGLRDHLSHGFHRYSVTTDWNLPHFEKMVSDNAQLLSCYSDAWALGRDPEILGTIYSLVEYFTASDSSILSPQGVWYSAEDADSIPNYSPSANNSTDGHATEKKEGAFYVWSHKRLEDILGERDASVLAAHFGVKPDGNVPADLDMHDEFLNQNVLHIASTPSALAKQFKLDESEIVSIIKAGKAKLSDYRRSHRVAPEVDTKIILSTNALAITGLARAANTLATIDATRSKRCVAAARRALSFIKSNMYDSTGGKLTRIHDDPTSQAFIDDYAYLTHALLAVYDITFDSSYLTWAEKLQSYIDAHFQSTSGGYFQAEKSDEQLFRLKPGTDNSLPSPNGVIANNLFYLGSYLPEKKDAYEKKGREVLDAFGVEVIQHPFLYVGMLSAVVMEQTGVKQLIVPKDMSNVEIGKVKGFGRTVVRGDVKKVMICTKDGVCRELRDGELEDHDGEEEAA